MIITRIGSYIFPSFPPELESEFRRQYNEIGASEVWVGLLIGGFGYLTFYPAVNNSKSMQTFAARGAVVALFLIVTLIPRPILGRHLQTIMVATWILSGVGAIIINSIRDDNSNFCRIELMLTLFLNFFFFRLLFLPAIICAVTICAAYNLAAIAQGLEPERVLATNFYSIFAVIGGGAVTYLLERLFRTQFLTEIALARERDALARQRHADSRYIEWLQQLAAFLRHEVRQPIAQINSSIELLQLTFEPDENQKSYIGNASLGAQHVWELVERASRATDAEAFVRLSQPQSIELHHILGELVEAYRHTCSRLDFRLEGRAAVHVNADPTLIKEAFSNLLSNAGSFALEDSTVQVTLEQNGERAIITMCNQGPLLQGNADELFGPFASTRAGLASEHQGLGLYLVRLIAEHHGGEATICNLEDKSGVKASIVLPILTYESQSSTQR